MTAANPWRRAALLFVPCAFLLGACGSGASAGHDGGDASEDDQSAHEELPPGTVWPGSITRTLVLNKREGGRHVVMWREERWENFRVSGGSSRTTAGFDTDWSLTELVRETSTDCFYRREARGTAAYPWFMFETDPFNELEYRIYSGGTGETEPVEGTMHGRCRNTVPPEVTTTYQTAPSWLPALPFELPAEYQVPGYTPPDASQFGAIIAGRIDPSTPDLIRGRWHGRVPGDDAVVTLTWSLNRAGECNEEEAKALLRQQRQAVERALQAGETAVNTGGTRTHLVALTSTASSYSVSSVTGAVHGALAADYVTVAPAPGATAASGLVRFAVRLSRDGRILESLEAMQRIIESTCVPDGSFEGARTILAGAVQWSGDEYRVTMRKFDVETGVIRDAVAEDGRGGVERLNATLQNMILNFATAW